MYNFQIVEKRWIYKDEPNVESIGRLSKEININEYLSKILVQRGIDSFEKAKDFFRPSMSQLHDPFLMLNMDKAVNRLTEAVSNEEKILIYGDYDVDGTTSVSLVFLFLKQFNSNIAFYIPDRYTEGYGISKHGIDYAIEEKFDLVIALDCGVRAVNQAIQAKEGGIDLIICDHHLPGDELPNVLALLDPKQPGCKYPFKELSGCGVGFKLLEGFCQQNTIDKEKLYDFLDLVVVSIASDIVPIIGENRVLAHYGLKKLNQSPSAGLKSLIEISGNKKEMSIRDVVFTLGPRINAAGRLYHAKESVNLLIGDSSSTDEFADHLNKTNKERQAFDQAITLEALEMIEKMADRKSTVLFKEDWHKGVIGIVASRCIEHYHRPTIILTESKGKATGSARSVDGFDVHEAISMCDDLLEQYGGHTHAAGLTLPLENVQKFSERFEEVVTQKIQPEQLIPKIEIDTEIPFSFLSFKTYNVMQQMAPFGPKNMSPVFGTKNVIMASTPKILKEKHLKGFLKETNGNRQIECIGFGLANKIDKIAEGEPFQIAYHLEENNYMGNKTLILNLKDIRFDA